MLCGRRPFPNIQREEEGDPGSMAMPSPVLRDHCDHVHCKMPTQDLYFSTDHRFYQSGGNQRSYVGEKEGTMVFMYCCKNKTNLGS